MSSAHPKGFVTASHSVLFADPPKNCCDVCGCHVAQLGSDEDDDVDPSEHRVSGRGLLVWTRGEERRYQEPPLCPACASAIGLSALQRWEIEEDEG